MRVSVLALLVCFAALISACGDRAPRTFTVQEGRHVVAGAKPGDTIKCATGGGATVPTRGQGVAGSPSGDGSFQVGTQADGTVVVRCE
jgi:hypothetical protein